jgi:proteasome lid subunit RPN8/RPN11
MCEREQAGACRFDPAALELLIAAARRGRERCGLLFGAHDAALYHVETAHELVNRAELADSFRIDPAEMAALAQRERLDGRELLGAWHTHPTASAELSRADREGAPTDWLSVVIACDGELRVYAHGSDAAARELEWAGAQAPRPK